MRMSNQPLIISIKKICFLINIVICTSCNEQDLRQQISFRVTNNTQNNIDFLILSTDKDQGKSLTYKIPKGSSIDSKVDFKGVDRTDGAYKMKYKFSQSKDTLFEQFGYYTNGYPLEKELIINIYADSISMKFVPLDAMLHERLINILR